MKARIPQGMGGGNMNSMLKQAQKMQEDLAAKQAELDAAEYDISAGGGVVNIKQIARDICPPISEAQAEEAIEILKEVGLVKKLASGKLALTDAHLTVGGPEKASAVREFQKQVLGLASDALDNVPVAERNISTLTLSVDQSCFEDLGDMLREFRRLVQKRVDEAKSPDRVMQLSMAFYPVARKGDLGTSMGDGHKETK